jgi:hypothetical protein
MGVGRLWICSSRGPSEHFTSLKGSALPTPLRLRKNDDHGNGVPQKGVAVPDFEVAKDDCK